MVSSCNSHDTKEVPPTPLLLSVHPLPFERNPNSSSSQSERERPTSPSRKRLAQVHLMCSNVPLSQTPINRKLYKRHLPSIVHPFDIIYLPSYPSDSSSLYVREHLIKAQRQAPILKNQHQSWVKSGFVSAGGRGLEVKRKTHQTGSRVQGGLATWPSQRPSVPYTLPSFPRGFYCVGGTKSTLPTLSEFLDD